VGLVFMIGAQRTLRLFTRPKRAPGILCFFLGVALVFLRQVISLENCSGKSGSGRVLLARLT
jgi:hypothetical protein